MPHLRSVLAFTALLLVCASGHARPLVIEEAARIDNPDPVRYRSFGASVATNGDYALISGHDVVSDYEVWHYAALLYRRVNGQWQFDRVLRQLDHEYDSYYFPIEFAMEGNLAAVGLARPFSVFRLTPSGWVDTGFTGALSEDIEIDGNRIVYGQGDYWDAWVAEFNADGTWAVSPLPGQPRSPDDENWGGPVDISGNYAIVGTPDTWDLEPQEIPVHERAATGWQLRGKIQVPDGTSGLGSGVAVRGDRAFVEGADGAYVWHLPWMGQPIDRLRAIDSSAFQPNVGDIEQTDDFIFVRSRSPDREADVINVFRDRTTGGYEHLAVLVAKNGVSLREFDIAGNVVMAGGSDNNVYVFELPTDFTTPDARHDNFESGNAAGWTPLPGSQFAVATSGSNRVYRQSSVAGDARALLGDTGWRDQSIEADLRPLQFNGSDRWVGLMTRYQDAQNFTYVTLRSGGTVQLRRVRGGTVSELARAPLAVTVNRNYRVHLQSVGSTHRVYVDRQLLLEVDDSLTPQTGQAGIAMYRARADIDNVSVTPAPLTTIFANDFNTAWRLGSWRHHGTGQWTFASGVYSQNSVGGDARAFIGTPTGDQVVAATVRPTAYAAASGAQERWTGLMARYVDHNNYYYVSLRSGGTVSLRKVVNGTVTSLGSAPFAVSINTPYAVRLEAVGTQLRVFVNDVLRVQATDGSLPGGAGGLVTYKAAAIFDDYRAYQP